MSELKIGDLVSVDYRIKDFFFDRKAIMDKMSGAERKAMSKIGAFIRKSARQSQKSRKDVAAPGSPPSVHTDSKVYTLKNILFGYEPINHRVVIGPVLLSRFDRTRESGGNNTLVKADSTVPALHEFGGTATLLFPSGNERRARYAPHPFMGPALDRERKNGKLLDAWRDLL